MKSERAERGSWDRDREGDGGRLNGSSDENVNGKRLSDISKLEDLDPLLFGYQPEVHAMAKRKLMNSSIAQERFKRSILEAAADLTHEFHGNYLNRLLMSHMGRSLLDNNFPSSSFDTVKKGFLFHLNATGHYLVLREHLRHSVTHIIQQCGLVLRPTGFQNHREFQNFLHDMYIFLIDEMHECLNDTGANEGSSLHERFQTTGSPQGPGSTNNNTTTIPNSHDLRITQEHLLHFAEEASSQGDPENCHRLHLQRICRNNESAESWLDFAIMWCSKGDDRMAEIAIREALKLDPQNINALLLAGIIAARHKDERAVGFLGQALLQRPLAPEILVLLATAHRLLGNPILSKYFFLKARLLHNLLTGRDSSKTEEDLAHFSFSVSVNNNNENQFTSDSVNNNVGFIKGDENQNQEDLQISESGPVPPGAETQSLSSGAGAGPGSSSGNNGKHKVRKVDKQDALKSERHNKHRMTGTGTVKTIKGGGDNIGGDASQAVPQQLQDPQQQTQSESLKQGGSVIPPDSVTPMITKGNPMYTRRSSISAKDISPILTTEATKLSYDLPLEINENTVDQMFLPRIGATIQFCWDVTRIETKLPASPSTSPSPTKTGSSEPSAELRDETGVKKGSHSSNYYKHSAENDGDGEEDEEEEEEEDDQEETEAEEAEAEDEEGVDYERGKQQEKEDHPVPDPDSDRTQMSSHPELYESNWKKSSVGGGIVVEAETEQPGETELEEAYETFLSQIGTNGSSGSGNGAHSHGKTSKSSINTGGSINLSEKASFISSGGTSLSNSNTPRSGSLKNKHQGGNVGGGGGSNKGSLTLSDRGGNTTTSGVGNKKTSGRKSKISVDESSGGGSRKVSQKSGRSIGKGGHSKKNSNTSSVLPTGDATSGTGTLSDAMEGAGGGGGSGSGSSGAGSSIKITGEDAADSAEFEGGEKKRHVWTHRFGSEYIWAAQLLLQFHAHDFIDGILARELFYTDNRSVPFLYLLAQSLLLRKREREAKTVLNEIMQQSELSKHPYLWELKGHIHNALSETAEAIESYERCIEYSEPSQNLHLTYLRFGTLCSETPNTKLARSIFLKGVTSYPSLYMWLGLGNLCYRMGAYDDAETAYAHANRMDYTNPAIWGHLSIVSLAQGNKTLAEQCYKWAVRFGLKKGPILDDIKSLQEQRGYGDPSFPRVPNCIPHDYFLRRLGRQSPLEFYRNPNEAVGVGGAEGGRKAGPTVGIQPEQAGESKKQGLQNQGNQWEAGEYTEEEEDEGEDGESIIVSNKKIPFSRYNNITDKTETQTSDKKSIAVKKKGSNSKADSNKKEKDIERKDRDSTSGKTRLRSVGGARGSKIKVNK